MHTCYNTPNMPHKSHTDTTHKHDAHTYHTHHTIPHHTTCHCTIMWQYNYISQTTQTSIQVSIRHQNFQSDRTSNRIDTFAVLSAVCIFSDVTCKIPLFQLISEFPIMLKWVGSEWVGSDMLLTKWGLCPAIAWRYVFVLEHVLRPYWPATYPLLLIGQAGVHQGLVSRRMHL